MKLEAPCDSGFEASVILADLGHSTRKLFEYCPELLPVKVHQMKLGDWAMLNVPVLSYDLEYHLVQQLYYCTCTDHEAVIVCLQTEVYWNDDDGDEMNNVMSDDDLDGLFKSLKLNDDYDEKMIMAGDIDGKSFVNKWNPEIDSVSLLKHLSVKNCSHEHGDSWNHLVYIHTNVHTEYESEKRHFS
uniref:Uncharacterized protein n=1 Tax=Tetranychus urticae TaxID=32264 RepID=T1K3T5_TETUR